MFELKLQEFFTGTAALVADVVPNVEGYIIAVSDKSQCHTFPLTLGVSRI